MSRLSAATAELIRLFESSDLTELAVEQGDKRLFVRKGDGLIGEVAPVEQVPAAPVEVALKAHMVGVFFWGKDKGAESALRPRQRVEKGQVVGFIEAMGIMNEVESQQAGGVVAVYVANGDPVEYGQELALLEP